MAEIYKPSKAYWDDVRKHDELVFGASLHVQKNWLSSTARREWKTDIENPNRSVAKYEASHPRWLLSARRISLVLAPLRTSGYYRGEPVWHMEGRVDEGHERFSIFNQIIVEEDPSIEYDALRIRGQLGIPPPTEADYELLLEQLKHVHGGSGVHDLPLK